MLVLLSNIVKSRNQADSVLDLIFNRDFKNVFKAAFCLPEMMPVQEPWSANKSYGCCSLRSLVFLGLIISTIYFAVSLIALFKNCHLWQMLQIRSYAEF